MRGTGYAIGEILIFLAIAAIIGFLIGWLVFYRRPGQSGTQLATVNPNHVKRLEERSKAVDGKLAGIETRAKALLVTLAKAPRPGGTAAVGTTTAEETAPAKITIEAGTQPATHTKDKVEASTQPATDTKDKDKAEAGTQKTTDTKDKVEAGTQLAADTKDNAEAGTQPATDAKADTKDKAEAGTQPATDAKADAKADTKDKDKAEAGTQKTADTKVETDDDYLSDADERISKLEETLDKLSEKLAEFGDD